MNDSLGLNAEERTTEGKSSNKSLRRNGAIPAVLYGEDLCKDFYSRKGSYQGSRKSIFCNTNIKDDSWNKLLMLL